MAKATKSKAAKPKATTSTKRRPWTDADKEHAIAVYVTTGNLSKTSRQTGVPISTLRGWLAEQPPEKVKEAREDAQAEFVKKAWDAVSAHVEHLQDKDVVKATSARDSATIAGILIDKIQLVTGQPTSNVKQQVDGQVTQRYEYDIVQHIVTDPESRDTARDLFRRGLSSVGQDLGGGRTA